MSSRDRIPDHPEELELLDYLVGQLPPEASDDVRRHVATCRACRRTIADLELTVDELDRLPTVAIPHDASYASGQGRPQTRFRTYIPAIAIVIVAAVVLATVGVDRGSRPAPPSTTTISVGVEAIDAAAGVQGTIPEAQPYYDQEGRVLGLLVPDRRYVEAVQILRKQPGSVSKLAVVPVR